MDVSSPYALGTIAGLVALGVYYRQSARRSSLPLPPGPKALPIVGNLFDMPQEKAWVTYREWNDLYGDVICVDALGQKIVVLGSTTAVSDLLDKRGAKYSSRALSPILQLMKWGWSTALTPYGETWRMKRKLLHSQIHSDVIEPFRPIQAASARRLARDILRTKTDPQALSDAIRLNFGQTIMKSVYGVDVHSHEDSYIALPAEIIEYFSEAVTPGRFLIDAIPLLKYVPSWFPGAGFQKLAIKNQIATRATLDNPIKEVQEQMANGTAPPSIARNLLEEDATRPAAESQVELIKEIAGIAYVAGSETTVATVLAFFLAMLVNPEVQTKAQAEVDRVVGKDRLPEPEDRKDMPYCEAVINECLRWLPVLPMAIPHFTSEDDEYKGYFIPKDTIVLPANWSILHNAADYPDPDRFNPDRYLTPDGKIDPAVRNPRTACFGHGRRQCPGRFFADASLFMTMATLLATIDVVRAKDDAGNEIIPNVDVFSGIISHPKPFPWAVRSRGKYAEDMVAAALAAEA